MKSHKSINYKLKFDLNNPYIPTEEEIVDVLNGRDDVVENEPIIEEVENVQIVDVVVDRVGFKDVEKTLVTLKQFLKLRPIDVTPLVHRIHTLQKET